MKAWIKADKGQRVEIPINADGTVKWLTEPVKEKLEVQ